MDCNSIWPICGPSGVVADHPNYGPTNCSAFEISRSPTLAMHWTSETA